MRCSVTSTVGSTEEVGAGRVGEGRHGREMDLMPYGVGGGQHGHGQREEPKKELKKRKGSSSPAKKILLPS